MFPRDQKMWLSIGFRHGAVVQIVSMPSKGTDLGDVFAYLCEIPSLKASFHFHHPVNDFYGIDMRTKFPVNWRVKELVKQNYVDLAAHRHGRI